MGKGKEKMRAGISFPALLLTLHIRLTVANERRIFCVYIFITGTAILAPISVCAPKLKVGATLSTVL